MASNSGLSMTLKVTQAQAVLAKDSGLTLGRLPEIATAIVLTRGSCLISKVANDHTRFALCRGVNWLRLAKAWSAMAASKGWCSKLRAAYAQAVLDSSCAFH